MRKCWFFYLYFDIVITDFPFSLDREKSVGDWGFIARDFVFKKRVEVAFPVESYRTKDICEIEGKGCILWCLENLCISLFFFQLCFFARNRIEEIFVTYLVWENVKVFILTKTYCRILIIGSIFIIVGIDRRSSDERIFFSHYTMVNTEVISWN